MDHPIPKTSDAKSCQIVLPGNQAGRRHGTSPDKSECVGVDPHQTSTSAASRARTRLPRPASSSPSSAPPLRPVRTYVCVYVCAPHPFLVLTCPSHPREGAGPGLPDHWPRAREVCQHCGPVRARGRCGRCQEGHLRHLGSLFIDPVWVSAHTHQSYDATIEFESTTDEIVSIFERITGEKLGMAPRPRASLCHAVQTSRSSRRPRDRRRVARSSSHV